MANGNGRRPKPKPPASQDPVVKFGGTNKNTRKLLEQLEKEEAMRNRRRPKR